MGKAEKTRESWQERRTKIRHKWAVLFFFAEWICEQVSYFLGRWAFLDILGHIGRLTILIAVITYFLGADERRMQAEDQRKAKHYQAWQVINIAQGKPGGGGRLDALQDLNSDGISLAYVDASEAWLPGLNLENATLYRANLAGATLGVANLSAANLHSANLTGADLNQANLAGANLVWANLTKAGLPAADLSNANLTNANLNQANLAWARLDGANLKDIRNWQSIRLEDAYIRDVKNAPDGFTTWAKDAKAVTSGSLKEWEQEKKKWLEKEREAEEGR